MNSILKSSLVLTTLSFVLMISCTHEVQEMTDLDSVVLETIKDASPEGTIDHFILPHESDLNSIPQDPKNPLSPAKVELGKMLFHETGIALNAVQASGMGTFSCSSCHIASAGFKPGRQQGIADGGWGFGEDGEDRTMNGGYREDQLDVQGARPLSVLNGAFVTNSFWNGQFGAGGANEGTEHVWGEHRPATEINHLGFQGIESQNFEGVELHRILVDAQVAEELGYKELFDESFPDVPEEERYNNTTTALALSAYVRSLMTSRAPFQDYLKDDRNALTEDEKKGALIFFGKAGCARCHNGPSLGSMTFHALGVKDLYHRDDVLFTGPDDFRNLGRGGFTGREEDNYKFKVPQLYNLKGSKFYFHGSSKESIRDVVEYFNEGIPENENVPESRISPFFTPLGLTDEEVDQLTAFLEHGLYDPHLDRYVPESLPSGNCFPNADAQSLIDMDCN